MLVVVEKYFIDDILSTLTSQFMIYILFLFLRHITVSESHKS